MSQTFIKILATENVVNGQSNKDFTLLTVEGEAIIEFTNSPRPLLYVNGNEYLVTGPVYVMGQTGATITTFAPRFTDGVEEPQPEIKDEVTDQEGPFVSDPVFNQNALITGMSGGRFLITGPKGTFITEGLELNGLPIRGKDYPDLKAQVRIADLQFNETETVAQALGQEIKVTLRGESQDLYCHDLLILDEHQIGMIGPRIQYPTEEGLYEGYAVTGTPFTQNGNNAVYLADDYKQYIYKALNNDQLTLSVFDYNRQVPERMFAAAVLEIYQAI